MKIGSKENKLGHIYSNIAFVFVDVIETVLMNAKEELRKDGFELRLLVKINVNHLLVMFFSKFENRTGFSALADSFYYQWFSIFRLFPILKICLNFSFIHKYLKFNEIVILLHFFGRLLCEY